MLNGLGSGLGDPAKELGGEELGGTSPVRYAVGNRIAFRLMR